jgi:hypothetical protein
MLALARKRATREAAQSPHGGQASGTAYDLLLGQLAEHRRQLKDIQSIERKIAAKAVFLPVYAHWLAATLAANTGATDLVFSTCLVWTMDVGDYARALELAEYAMRHSLDTPDNFERSLPAALQEEFAIGYLSGKWPADLPAAPALQRVADLTQDSDVQIRAKLHKAIGYALAGKQGADEINVEALEVETAKACLAHLTRALTLHEQVGVKKDVERITRALKKAGQLPA